MSGDEIENATQDITVEIDQALQGWGHLSLEDYAETLQGVRDHVDMLLSAAREDLARQ